MRTFVFAICLMVLAACGGEERDAEGMPSEVLPPVSVAPAPRVELPRIYDEEGELLPSDDRVAGLTLPRGLASDGGTDERRHVYYAHDIPIGAILRYFGPRLTTGQVEAQPGGGARYRNAIPREVTSGAVPLDVGIFPVSGGDVLVEVREIPPPPVTPPSEPESIRRLTEAMQTAD
jgi:hypothetical protein